MKMKQISLVLVMIALMALVGCSKPAGTDVNNPDKEVKQEDNTNTEKEVDKEEQKESVARSITVNGSTSVLPLLEELAKAYKETDAKATIDIQGGGSGVGIKSANEGVVDIGMSSRELKTEEKTLTEYKIAIDGIAVILNPNNPIKDLTSEQIKDIYSGKITDWSEVGGNQGKITVVTREEGSGTRGAFVELVGLEVDKVDTTTETAITQGSTGAVMTTVAGDPNAIGYASYGSAKEATNVNRIQVDGSDCTEENIYSGAYVISRPFLLVTNGEPDGLAKDFLDFILGTEGQNLVESKSYLKSVVK